jgi:glycosyltransferase involved in cell wall biosynthesis
MAVHNGEKYLREAVESVLGQTFRNFEFLVVNDGSTDDSPAILRSFVDSRIRLIDNGVRKGLSSALNDGLDLARGEYIARMDSDDVCLPERLSRQVAFMERHIEVGACGSWIRLIGEGEGTVWRYPTDPEIIRCGLLFESKLAHPSVMIRRDSLEKASLRYDPSFTSAQDYDLWVRFSERFNLANIGEVLLDYRRHPLQAGQIVGDNQRYFAARIRLTQLRALGIEPTDADVTVHEGLSTWTLPGTRDAVERAREWLGNIWAANDARRLYPGPALSRVLGERWSGACEAASGIGLWAWKTFHCSSLSAFADLAWKQRMKFLIRCAIMRTPSRSIHPSTSECDSRK